MEQVINVAVDWWCQWFDKIAPQDAGDELLNRMLIMAFLTQRPCMTAEQTGQFSERIARFRQYLHDAIEKEMGKDSECILKTDYSPEDTLMDVCIESNMSGAYFPIKTVMWISPNRVSVRCGYEKEEQVLYPAQ